MVCMRALVPLFAWLALLVGVVMSGCATMNRDECVTADWQTVGYEDGAAGRSGDRIAQYRKSCAKHGITPDLRAYQAGREQGLREYCQPQNGYRLGERGGDYPGFCPEDLASAFEAAWRDGSELYGLRERVNEASNDLRHLRAELQRAEDDMIAASATIVDGNADKAVRAQAVLDVKRLADRQAELRLRIREREEDHVHFQRDLDRYLASAPPR